jgi:hypothetical protein
VTGNQVRGLGPPGEFTGETIGIEVHAAFLRADVTDNTILRGATDNEQLANARWFAIRIHGSDGDDQVRLISFNPLLIWASLGPLSAVFTKSRVFALARSADRVLTRGNHAESSATEAPVIEIVDVESCTLTENRCVTQTDPRRALVIVDAQVSIASHNTLVLPRGTALDVRTRAPSQGDNAPGVVLGNAAHGPILFNGQPLGNPWRPLNFIYT